MGKVGITQPLYLDQGDPRDVPIYSLPEAAKFLRIPKSTVRSWFFGQANFHRVLRPAGKGTFPLSFLNLIEAHFLDAIRRGYKIPLPKVRKSLQYAEDRLRIERPLAYRIRTDGTNLFIKVDDQKVNITKYGQLAMPEIIKVYLPRIKYGRDGISISFFPFIKRKPLGLAKSVVIIPAVSSGSPVVTGTGVRTKVLYERFSAGDSIDFLAEEYGLNKTKIEDAIRYEQPAA